LNKKLGIYEDEDNFESDEDDYDDYEE